MTPENMNLHPGVIGDPFWVSLEIKSVNKLAMTTPDTIKS